MSIFSPSRHRLALAVLTVVIIAGLGTFGAIRVDASSPAHAAPTIVPEVDVAAVIQKTITDWQSYSGRLEARSEKVAVRPAGIRATIVSVNFKDWRAS